MQTGVYTVLRGKQYGRRISPYSHSGSGESLSLRSPKLETGSGTSFGSQLGCYSRLPTPTGIESILETTCAHTNMSRYIAPTMSERNRAYGMACPSKTPAFLRSAWGRGMFPRRSRARIPHPSEARGPLSFKLKLRIHAWTVRSSMWRT